MRTFNKRNSFGGRRNDKDDRRGRDSYGKNDSGRREMYRAICDECGKSCEVPFKPTGDKPVYCSKCYTPPEFNENRDRRNDRQMYKAVCDECGRSCEVPFKPSKGKEIFCNDCFGKDRDSSFSKKEKFEKNDFSPEKKSDKKHELILAKLDKIISLLENRPQNETIKEEITEILEDKKPKRITKKIELDKKPKRKTTKD